MATIEKFAAAWAAHYASQARLERNRIAQRDWTTVEELRVTRRAASEFDQLAEEYSAGIVRGRYAWNPTTDNVR